MTIKLGDKFSRLIVESFHHKDKQYREYWCCRCACGNIKVIREDHLKNGTVSCGCRKSESAKVMHSFRKKGGRPRLKDEQDVCLKSLMNNYKTGAKSRHLKFLLTVKQFRDLTKGYCFYCGRSPEQVFRPGKRYTEGYLYNGIDRIDSFIGYIPENCVPCCKKCNRAKDRMSYDEFISMIDKIHSYVHFNERHNVTSS